MNWLLIFIGGGIGSLARFSVGLLSSHFSVSNFPIGTFISNSLACLILVLVTVGFNLKSQEYAWIQPLLITGFCGGFSTFSTFSNETVQLLQQGNSTFAFLNIAISLATGIGIIYWFQASNN